MIFSALDKIKRNAIFSAILLMALGVIILICPQEHAPSLILAFGYILMIFAVVLMLMFIGSGKSIMDYAKFIFAILILIGGLCVLVYRANAMTVLAYLFGMLLILDGLHSLFHSVTYSRRAHKRAWWVLAILSLALVSIGVMLFCNPFFSTQKTLMRAIGYALLIASAVSIVRLIWTWPVKKNNPEIEEVTQDVK